MKATAIRRTVLGLAGLGILAGTASADMIVWGSGQYLKDSGGTLLPGNRVRDETTTAFIQLLYLGANGTYDSPAALDGGTGGDGAHGDDEVIATSWVGDGNPVFLPTNPGIFTGSDQPNTGSYTSEESDFAIRVFDTPVSDEDWAAGNIPSSGNYNYREFIDPVMTAGDYQLSIGSDLLTTLSVVPEPASVLVFAGGLTFALRRRRR